MRSNITPYTHILQHRYNQIITRSSQITSHAYLYNTDTYTVEELAEKLQASSSVIRRRAAYWQSHGVLKEEITDTYKLNKDHVSTGPAAEVVEEEEAESATASAEQQKEEELQVGNQTRGTLPGCE